MIDTHCHIDFEEYDDEFRLYLVAVIVRDGCDAALFRKLNVKLEKPRGIKNFIEQ